MKRTREALHQMIDAYPPHIGAEAIFVDITYNILNKYPRILPYYWNVVGRATSDIFDQHIQTLYLVNERASYLESYLAGKMYPEEITKKPEYIEIQRGHAETIVNATEKTLGVK